MSVELPSEFVHIARRQLSQRQARIESCLERLSDEQIWSRAHEVENAVGNLVLHLCGNVRQWIIAGVGQSADERDRDAEFTRREPLPKDQLVSLLRETLAEADTILTGLSATDLTATRQIQVYEVTVMHAVAHVFAHFAEHTGQIIWATKRLTAEDLGFYSYLKPGAAPVERGEP